MLADFFTVVEQDSAPIDGLRHRSAKIGDTAGAFIMDDTGTPAERNDFLTTFMAVARREEAVSEPAEQKDPGIGEDDPTPDFPSEAGTGSGVEGSGRQGEGSSTEGVTRGKAAGANGTEAPPTTESGRGEGMLANDAVGDRNNGSEPDKPSTQATAEQKGHSLSGGKEGTASPIADQNASSKGAFLGRDDLRGVGSKEARGGHTNRMTDAEALKSGAQEMKEATPVVKGAGIDTSVSEAAPPKRADGQQGEAAPKRSPQGGINSTLKGFRGDEDLGSVTKTGSLRGGDGEGGETSSKRDVNSGLHTIMTDVRGKKSLASLSKSDDQPTVKDGKGRASVSEKESLKMTGSQVDMRTQKGDASTSRGVFHPHQIRPADQEGGKTGSKITSNDLSGPKTVAAVTGAVSSLGMERAEKDASATSKKGSASAQTASESRKTGSRDGGASGVSLGSTKSRQGNDVPRFNLGRDDLGKQNPYKADPGEQRSEPPQEKGKEEAAAKLAYRMSSVPSEQAFDKGASKSEPMGSDNATSSAGNSASSLKASGNITRFAEAETVRRSFQENGVRQLVEKAALNLKEGRQEFRIELKPESLGSVKLQVSTENHQVTIRIITELPIAKEVIENNMSHLRAELQGQGIEIDKCEVSLSDRADQEALNRRFSRSRKTEKGMGAKAGPSMVSSDPDAAWEGAAVTGRTGTGVINLFA